MWGRVSDLPFMISHRQPKLIAIHKQSDDDVMHLDRSGKADRLACETLEPGPQCQMLPLDFLRVPLARSMLVGVEMTRGRAPIIRIIAHDAQGLEQPFELQKHLVLTSATDLRQHLARVVIDRMPQPALRVLLSPIRPHRIDFRVVRPPDDHVHVARVQGVEERLVHRGERRFFFFTRS